MTTNAAADDLSPLEWALLDAVARDEPLVVADECPGEVTGSAGSVRAQVVRDILLGRPVGGQRVEPGPRGVRMWGVVVSGQLDLAAVRSPVPLHLTRCRLRQPAVLADARIPQLILNGSHLPGVEAERLRVDSNLMLADTVITAAGSSCAVRLLGAVVGGQLSFTDAALRAGGDCALHADGIGVDGDLLLRGVGHRFTADAGGKRGAVRLNGARIGGNLECDHADLAASKGPALTLERAEIKGNLYLRDVWATGGPPAAVVLVGAQVGGQLSCTGSRLGCAEGTAMVGDDFQAGGGVFLNDGFHANGGRGHPAVRLIGARIGGHLDCVGGVLWAAGREDLVLDLRFASVGKLLRLSTRGATQADPGDPRPALGEPGLVALDGLTYPVPPEGMDCAEWIDVLGRQTPSFTAQPYQQLAGTYRAAGRERDARQVLIARQHDLLRRGDLTGWSRERHRALGLLLGYGYQSWRSLVALVATVMVAVVFVLALARWSGAVVHPSRPGGPVVACATVEQIGVGIDLALPLIQTGAGSTCELAASRPAEEPLVALSWVFQVFGWAFATLFVAGYTGLIRTV
ncbi:MAG TPA: hypothetical protein VFX70_17605 [Mycobacteriales bacterium]|nr:hypothetical protein [Mycobacteriales bacterium]